MRMKVCNNFILVRNGIWIYGRTSPHAQNKDLIHTSYIHTCSAMPWGKRGQLPRMQKKMNRLKKTNKIFFVINVKRYLASFRLC